MTTETTETKPAPLTAWWGVGPQPVGAIAGWGARGIVETACRAERTPTGRVRIRRWQVVYESVCTVGLLHDRQSSFGPGALQAALFRIVNDRVLPEVRSAVEAAPRNPGGEIRVAQGVCARWENQGPGGYCWISVWILDEGAPDLTDVIWSGGAKGFQVPPVPGDRIKVTMNGIGPAVVLGRFEEHGYLGLMVLPDNPPEWLVKQSGASTPVGVYGAEIAPLEAAL